MEGTESGNDLVQVVGGVYSPSLASGDSGLQPDAQASSCEPLPPSQPRKTVGRSASVSGRWWSWLCCCVGWGCELQHHSSVVL